MSDSAAAKLKQQARQQQLSQQVDEITSHCGDELERLVSSQGYRYAKQVAMSYVIQPYECDPPGLGGSDEDRAKWESYNTLTWGFQRLFSLLEKAAKQTKTHQKGPQADDRG